MNPVCPKPQMSKGGDNFPTPLFIGETFCRNIPRKNLWKNKQLSKIDWK